jgi:hypothetical protein
VGSFRDSDSGAPRPPYLDPRQSGSIGRL